MLKVQKVQCVGRAVGNKQTKNLKGNSQTTTEILNVLLIVNSIECMMKAIDTLPRKTHSHALTVITGTHQMLGKLPQGGHGSLDTHQYIYWTLMDS